MKLRAKDWNVVVVGRWNRAILTPAGIARRLFKLAENTPIEVLVPLDVVGPPQVRHDGIAVLASEERLMITADHAQANVLDKAMISASNALCDLPQTPVSAAGVNLRFHTDEPTPELRQAISQDWDNRLSDENFTIDSRSIARRITKAPGSLNISLSQGPDSSFTILFNFDLQSSDIEILKAWVSTPASELVAEAEKILTTTLGFESTEIDYGIKQD